MPTSEAETIENRVIKYLLIHCHALIAITSLGNVLYLGVIVSTNKIYQIQYLLQSRYSKPHELV
jgi:hypothetical protein